MGLLALPTGLLRRGLLVLLLLRPLPPAGGMYRSTPSGGGFEVSVLRGAPGLLDLLLPPLYLTVPGISTLSNRLLPGLMAVSKGLRPALALPRIKSTLGAVGSRVRRIGWPAAFAPSNSRIARLAEEVEAYVTKAVPEERPARSKRRDRDLTGAIRVNRSWQEAELADGLWRESAELPRDPLPKGRSVSYQREAWHQKKSYIKRSDDVVLHRKNDRGISPARFWRVSIHSSGTWLTIWLSGWEIVNRCSLEASSSETH